MIFLYSSIVSCSNIIKLILKQLLAPPFEKATNKFYFCQNLKSVKPHPKLWVCSIIQKDLILMGKQKKDNNQHYKPFLCAALKQWMKTLQNWIGSKANKPSTKSVFLLKAAVNFQRIKTYLSITLWFLATISHLELSQLEKSRQGMLLSSIRCPDSGRLSGKTAGTSPGAIRKRKLLKYGE